METVLAIIFIIFGILQIILFFKIWGMTSDVREIRNRYLTESRNNNKNDSARHSIQIGSTVRDAKNNQEMIIKSFDPDTQKYSCYSQDGLFINSFSAKELILDNNKTESLVEGTLVVELKTGNQMRTGERLDNGKYKCYSGTFHSGDFMPDEIMEFDKWVKYVYKK